MAAGEEGTRARIGAAETLLEGAPKAAPTIRRNTLVNLVGSTIPLLVLLVTVPRYLDVVGQARYGVLVVVWLLLAYFGLFDLGLGRAVANRLAKADAADERATVFWTALALAVAFGLAGGAILLGVGHLLADRVFELRGGLRAEAVAGLPWLAASVPALAASSVVRGVLEGSERFVASNVVGVLSISLFQIVPLGFAYARGPELSTVMTGTAVACAAAFLAALASCPREIGSVASVRFDRALVGSLSGFGGWVTVTGVVGPLMHILDRFVIAAVAGARAVTYYAVPFSLVARAEVLPSSLARTLFPRLSALDGMEARTLARDAVRTLAVVMTPLVVAGLVVLEPFLRLWVGDELAAAGAPVGAILLLGLWFNGLAYIPFTLLQAQGRPDVPAKLHVLELPPYLVALGVGLAVAGIEGAAWAWTLRAVADAALLFSRAGIPWRRERALVPAAVVVALAAVGALAVFDDPVLRGILGGAAVLFACGWALRVSRRSVHMLFRGLPASGVAPRTAA